MLDGANIIDPGCNCWSIAVVNPDMTAGGQGSDIELRRRQPEWPGHRQRDQQRWLCPVPWAGLPLCPQQRAEREYLGQQSIRATPGNRPKYYYPGGNFGGPVKVPGTSFNHNNKLLFWFGYEYYYQLLPSASPLESYVPTPAMEAGNFTSSGAGNSALCPGGFTATATNWCNNLSGTVAPDGTPITGGVIPSQYLDSGAAALMKMFPAANANPLTTPGGYNYYLPISTQQNGHVWRASVDYNLNESNKLFVTYQTGSNTSTQPGHIYWNPSYDVLYPGGSIANPTISRGTDWQLRPYLLRRR